ncbi:MAG: hypothetical protein AB3N64_09570 [Puniceicoccaceae bacterium]
MNATCRVFLTALMALGGMGLVAQETEQWLFEGLITEADPALAPDLQSGWVLAGSFFFNRLELQEEPVPPEARGGRLAGGIGQTELTIDLYHQLHFEARQVPGLAGFDYQNNDPDFDGRDMLGWFFPVQGELKDSGWTSRWLQIWLADPEGEMIRNVPPRISPYGIDYQSAWFRLTFENAAGEPVYADGRIDLFAPRTEVDSMDEETSWRGVAIELSDELMRKDSVIEELRQDLAASIARLEGLRNMVDLLVEERESLRQENRILQEEAEKADPQVQEKLTELEVEKSLLESRIDELSGQNQALAESLASSEVERLQLMQQLEDMENLRSQPVADSTGVQSASSVVVTRDNQPVGSMTIVEEPMVIEKPVLIEKRIPVKETPPETKVSPPPASKEKPKKPRFTKRHGPRKFR